MARRVLLRSAALPLALMLLTLGLGGSGALVVQQPPPRRGSGVIPSTTTTILLRMRTGPHDQPQQQQKHQQPRPTALTTLARLQRALAPLALSLLPVLAPRPLAPPAAAAAAAGTAATTTTQQPHAQGTLLSAPLLLVADGVDVAAIKQVADAEALAGFGKAQGEGGERLMGLVQPVLRLTPDQEGLFKRARIAESDNEYEKALRLYDRLTRVAPGYAYAWSNKGNAHIALGDLESGLDAYKRAIELLPGKSGDAWLVYLNKATTELALGQVNPCLADLEEARLLHGQPDVLLFANKALALERLGKYPQALENYENGVLTKPKEVSPWWLRYSLVLFEEQQDIKAMEIMRKVAGKFSKVDEIQAALATLVYAYGDTVEAERMWSEMSGQAQVQYRDETFLRETLRWPERMVRTVGDFKGLYTPRRPAGA